MIVNIKQCASTYDETLNVLKFSAVAQKVCVCVPVCVRLCVCVCARMSCAASVDLTLDFSL